MLVGVIFGCIRKRRATGESITREALAANTQFYGFLFVGILLLWNWFNELSSAYTAVGEDTSTLVWILIDAAVPLLSGVMGLYLLRGGSNKE